MGHLTFCSLIDRSVLACLGSTYGFIQRHYDTGAPLWTQARLELVHMANLLLILQASWDRRWSPVAICTDTSESGVGAVISKWSEELVGATGRVSERSRFRRREGHSARAAFFEAAGYRLSSRVCGSPESPMTQRRVERRPALQRDQSIAFREGAVGLPAEGPLEAS